MRFCKHLNQRCLCSSAGLANNLQMLHYPLFKRKFYAGLRIKCVQERLSRVRKLRSKRFSLNQSGFAFNWQWKQNLIVAWSVARQYIEASWTKFPTILGYTP